MIIIIIIIIIIVIYVHVSISIKIIERKKKKKIEEKPGKYQDLEEFVEYKDQSCASGSLGIGINFKGVDRPFGAVGNSRQVKNLDWHIFLKR